MKRAKKTVDVTVQKMVVESVSVPGMTGKSAYDIAVAHGFVGTEEEWLASLTADVRALAEQANDTANNASYNVGRLDIKIVEQIEPKLAELEKAQQGLMKLVNRVDRLERENWSLKRQLLETIDGVESITDMGTKVTIKGDTAIVDFSNTVINNKNSTTNFNVQDEQAGARIRESGCYSVIVENHERHVKWINIKTIANGLAVDVITPEWITIREELAPELLFANGVLVQVDNPFRQPLVWNSGAGRYEVGFEDHD